jgi:probable HAF family extracellular repeat protein
MRFSHLLVASLVTAPVFGAGDDARIDSRPATYCLYQIDPLPGMSAGESEVQVSGINDRGQVTGWISPADGSPFHAFVWDRKQGIRDLGTVPGHSSMIAAAINDAGTIVGEATDEETGETLAFVWTPRRGVRTLDTSLGGVGSFATAINRRGQIAGASTTANGAIHAFFRDVDGDIVDLGAFSQGRGFSSATAMNDRGQVVVVRADGDLQDAFVWDAHGGRQLLVPEPSWAFRPSPSDINNRGEVVGALLEPGLQRAFRWTRSRGIQLLGTLSGVDTDFTTAQSINDRGTIVGGSQTASGDFHGFVWEPRGGMRDLNELIDARSGLAVQPVLGTAMGINGEGAIAAGGVLPGEDAQRGYVMVPRRNRQGCR